MCPLTPTAIQQLPYLSPPKHIHLPTVLASTQWVFAICVKKWMVWCTVFQPPTPP